MGDNQSMDEKGRVAITAKEILAQIQEFEESMEINKSNKVTEGISQSLVDVVKSKDEDIQTLTERCENLQSGYNRINDKMQALTLQNTDYAFTIDKLNEQLTYTRRQAEDYEKKLKSVREFANKYRIKIETREDGSKLYYPQYKFLYMWSHFSSAYVGTRAFGRLCFLTEEKAREYLDKLIEAKKRDAVTKVEYRGYP